MAFQKFKTVIHVNSLLALVFQKFHLVFQKAILAAKLSLL